MRWWRMALGTALLTWVLGTAYLQARRRGRNLGIVRLGGLLVAAAALFFGVAALVPRPPMSLSAASEMVVASLALLAAAVALVLWRGFRG